MKKLTPTDLLAWSIQNKSEEPVKPSKIDPKWIEVLLGKPESARMKEIIQLVKDGAKEVELLDEFEMLVESIDNASDVGSLGLWPDLISFLTSDDVTLRKYSAWIIGTCCQNNMKCQSDFISNNGMEILVNSITNETDDQVRNKLIYLVSSVVLGNKAAFDSFISCNGLQEFIKLINGNTRKCLFFLNQLILESDAINELKKIDFLSVFTLDELDNEALSLLYWLIFHTRTGLELIPLIKSKLSSEPEEYQEILDSQ